MRILGSVSEVSRLPVRVLGGSAFSPNQIPGLKLWLRADLPSSIVASGSSVDSWTDQVAGHVFAQSTAGSKPQTGAVVNGKNAITFDGTDDYLNKVAGNILVGTVGMVFIAFKTPAVYPAGNGAVLATGSDTSSTTGAFCGASGIQNVSNTRYNRVVERSSAGDSQMTVRGSVGIAAATNMVLAVGSVDTSWVLRKNGAEETKVVIAGSDNGDWFGSGISIANTTVGGILRAGSLSNPMYGDFGEILAYDAVTLTAAQITKIEIYLAAKWGVTLA